MKKSVLPVLLSLLLAVPSIAQEIQIFYGSEIVVTASRRVQLRSQSFSNVKVITSDDIKKSGATTAADILRTDSDVNIKSTGGLGGISMAKLKSANSSQILVLVDGSRVNSSLLGVSDLGDIPLYNVERIEVVEEPISSVYGSDALGGVINIITKRGQANPVSAEIKYGSFGELGAAAGISGGLGRLTYYAAYNQLRSDGFRTNGDYSSKGYTLNLSVGDLASLKFNSSYSERGNPGVPSSAADPASASTPLDRQKDSLSNFEATFNPKVIGIFDGRLTVSQNMWDQKVHYQDFLAGTFVDDRYFSQITDVNMLGTATFSKLYSLTTGFEFKRDLGESSKAGIKTVDTISVYLDNEFAPLDPMSISLSLRADQNKNWGSVLTPRAASVLRLDDGSIFRLSVSKAFRAPTINELYWNDPSWGMYGNPNLKPENSDCAGLSYEKDDGALRTSLNYYINKISNMIAWSQTAPFSWQTVNIDSAKIEGIGLEVERLILDGTSVYLRGNLESCINSSTGKTLAYSPSQKFNAGFKFGSGALTGRLNVKGVSQVYTDAANTKTIPAYQVADLTVTGKLGASEISAGLYNMFDTSYYESVGADPVTWAERGYPMPGRRIEIGIKI